jgi:ketosteroid isomerase-like protein
MEDVAATTERFLEAFRRGEIERATSMLADDFEVVEPESLPYGGTFRGKDGFNELMAKLAEVWEFTDFEFEVFGTDENTTFHTTRLNATARATGRFCTTAIVEKQIHRDGKIRHCQVFPADTAEMLEALGAQGCK